MAAHARAANRYLAFARRVAGAPLTDLGPMRAPAARRWRAWGCRPALRLALEMVPGRARRLAYRRGAGRLRALLGRSKVTGTVRATAGRSPTCAGILAELG